jgi:hypothetical protein
VLSIASWSPLYTTRTRLVSLTRNLPSGFSAAISTALTLREAAFATSSSGLYET